MSRVRAHLRLERLFHADFEQVFVAAVECDKVDPHNRAQVLGGGLPQKALIFVLWSRSMHGTIALPASSPPPWPSAAP